MFCKFLLKDLDFGELNIIVVFVIMIMHSANISLDVRALCKIKHIASHTLIWWICVHTRRLRCVLTKHTCDTLFEGITDNTYDFGDLCLLFPNDHLSRQLLGRDLFKS